MGKGEQMNWSEHYLAARRHLDLLAQAAEFNKWDRALAHSIGVEEAMSELDLCIQCKVSERELSERRERPSLVECVAMNEADAE